MSYKGISPQLGSYIKLDNISHLFDNNPEFLQHQFRVIINLDVEFWYLLELVGWKDILGKMVTQP